MSKYIVKRKGVSQGNSKTNRKVYFINSSIFFSQSPLSLSSDESNKRSSCRKLLRTKYNSLKRSKRRIKLVDQSNRQPQWKNYHTAKSRSGIDLRRIKFRLGATCQGQITGGVWSKEESALHINAKELLAAFMAIQTFVKHQLQLTIHIKIDNMSAVAYINKMESTKSRDLNLLMKRIWDWCQDLQIVLTAEYLSGSQDLVAAWHFRTINDSSDWCLNRQIFHQIQK